MTEFSFLGEQDEHCNNITVIVMDQLKSSEVIFLLTLLNHSQCFMEVGGAVLEQFAWHGSLIGGDVIVELWVLFLYLFLKRNSAVTRLF